MQPTRTAGSGHRSRRLLPAPSLFGLAPAGVCLADRPAAPSARSHLTPSPSRFTLTAVVRIADRGGLFSVALSLGSRPPDVIRHRTSVEPGLSSRTCLSALVRAAVQPTDRRRDGDCVRARQGLCDLACM